MSYPSARGAQTYQQNQVITRSPLELVVMLYDGAISALDLAVDAANGGRLTARAEALSKAMGILSHLQSTLDIERGGPVAQELDRLYTYMFGRISDANLSKTTAPLVEVRGLLSKIREGWSGIAQGTR
jgi:flagellar protein FliS